MVVAKCCYFHPDPCRSEPILRSYVSNGLKLNHELDCCWKSISGNNSTKKCGAAGLLWKFGVSPSMLRGKAYALTRLHLEDVMTKGAEVKNGHELWNLWKGISYWKKTWILTDLTVFVETHHQKKKKHLNLAAICLAGRLCCKAAKMEHLATKKGRL